MSPVRRPAPSNSPDPDSARSRQAPSRREYSVTELARVTDCTVRNLRAYQDRGVLAPPARRGRVGIYDDSHVSRIKLIKHLLLRGYTLASIRDIVQAIDEGQDLRSILGLEADLTPRERPAASSSDADPATDADLPNAACPVPASFTAIAQALIDVVVRQINRDDNAPVTGAADVATLIQSIWHIKPLGMALVEKELNRALKEAAGIYPGEQLMPLLQKLRRARAQRNRRAPKEKAGTPDESSPC